MNYIYISRYASGNFGVVRSIFLLSLVARCLENVCCVAAVVKDSRFLSLGVLKYVVSLCKKCDGCSV